MHAFLYVVMGLVTFSLASIVLILLGALTERIDGNPPVKTSLISLWGTGIVASFCLGAIGFGCYILGYVVAHFFGWAP